MLNFKFKNIWVTAHSLPPARSLQSCPTLWPHRRQPTRLLCPWDSPGKNTGVGCHFLLQCLKEKSLGRVRLFAAPWTAAFQAPPSMGFSRQEYGSGVPLPSPNRNNSSYYWTVVVQYAKAVGNILFLNCVFLFNLLNNALSLPIF